MSLGRKAEPGVLVQAPTLGEGHLLHSVLQDSLRYGSVGQGAGDYGWCRMEAAGIRVRWWFPQRLPGAAEGLAGVWGSPVLIVLSSVYQVTLLPGHIPGRAVGRVLPWPCRSPS